MEENKATISYTDFEADIKARDEESRIVHWLGQDIVIRRFLTLREVLLFVSNVIDVCYQGEGDTLTYTPEVQAYAIQHSLVSFYTNIDLSDSEEEEGGDFSVYDFVTQSDIVDLIMDNIDLRQYESIVKAIASKIKYINEANSAAIMSEMGTLNATINEVIPQIQEFIDPENQEKMQGALAALSTFTEDTAIRNLAMEMVKNGSDL